MATTRNIISRPYVSWHEKIMSHVREMFTSNSNRIDTFDVFNLKLPPRRLDIVNGNVQNYAATMLHSHILCARGVQPWLLHLHNNNVCAVVTRSSCTRHLTI